MPSANSVLALGVVMPVLCAIFIYLRLWAKTRRTKYSWDDLMSVLAFVLLLAMSIILVIGVATAGLGKEGSQPSISNTTASDSNSELPTQSTTLTFGHYQFLVLILLGPGLGLTKLSMLFFYRRIFRGSTFNVASWVLIVAVIMWILFFFVLLLLLCGTRVDYLYTPEVTGSEQRPSCMDYEPIALSMAGTDVLLDLVVLALPIYRTLRLQIDAASKLLVAVVFAFGAVAVGASLGRLVGLIILYKGRLALLQQIAFVMFISVLELGLAVIATCLPTLGHLLPDPARQRIMKYIDAVIPSRLRRRSKDSLSTTRRTSGVTSGWSSSHGGQPRISRVGSPAPGLPQAQIMTMASYAEGETFFSTTSLSGGASIAGNSDRAPIPVTEDDGPQQQQANVPVIELEGTIPSISGAQIVPKKQQDPEAGGGGSSSDVLSPEEEEAKAILGATVLVTPAPGGASTPRSEDSSSDARTQQSSLLLPPSLNAELSRDENSSQSTTATTLVSARDARMRAKARREEAERQRQQQQQEEEEDGHIHVKIEILQTEERRDGEASAAGSSDAVESIPLVPSANPFLSLPGTRPDSRDTSNSR